MRFREIGVRLTIGGGLVIASLTACSPSVKDPPGQNPPVPAATAPGSVLHIAGGEIHLDLSLTGGHVTESAASHYVKTAAVAVATYFGKYPVKQVLVEVFVDGAGHEIHGQEFDGARIHLQFGPETRDDEMAGDWVATHEMFHLAYPDMGEKYQWMNEGLSDYLEPIARARIGELTPENVWQGFAEGMPQGQPEAGDAGLDNTHSWGRTYWGGCIYWLLADVRIRQATHNQKSLADALRAILAAGGDGSVTWELSRVFEVGDGATGVHVLRDLHSQLGNTPTPVDLDALWKELGVHLVDGKVTLDDQAPAAEIRKAITGR